MPHRPDHTPDQPQPKPEDAYVSRGGLKLAHALREFHLSPAGLVCADFGCNVGGFSECLLRHGARLVFAVDTGYGTLAWKLRTDARVRVMERTNALHAPPPADHTERPALIAIDMAWTPQRLCLPAALAWLAESPTARIVSLIKPHYETDPDEKRLLTRGVLSPDDADRIARRTLDRSAQWGVRPLALTRSPILGGGSGGGGSGRGNTEFLAVFARADDNTPDTGPLST